MSNWPTIQVRNRFFGDVLKIMFISWYFLIANKANCDNFIILTYFRKYNIPI